MSDARGPLQAIVDAAERGAVIQLAPGTYQGPVVISKPITLDGGGKATIDGGGKGTVIDVKGSGVTLQSLRVVNSGDQHNTLDAGIRLEGDHNVVRDSTIEECLFGIDLQQASDNIVRRNHITSKTDLELGVKGDAIRLWYGSGNRLESNVIDGARDFVVWYSWSNTIVGNEVSHGRYGLHFMYAKANLVENNTFTEDLVGINLMYSDGVVMRGNRIVHALGPAGTGIGFKESSNADVTGNEVLYNAIGLAFDISPFDPGTTIRVYGNKVAFNDVGVAFLSDRPGNIFKDNVFLSNSQPVVMRVFQSAASTEWEGNYWDDYEGFDRDHDGFGDAPFVIRSYADRLWMDVPPAAFFRGSPALATLDLVERLAPFTDPLELLHDKKPRMSREFVAMTPDKDQGLVAKQAAASAADAAENGAALEGQGPGGNAAVPEATQRLDPFGLYKSDVGTLKK